MLSDIPSRPNNEPSRGVAEGSPRARRKRVQRARQCRPRRRGMRRVRRGGAVARCRGGVNVARCLKRALGGEARVSEDR